MAFVFQIKRRLAGDPGQPTQLQTGELAFNEVDNTLYIGVSNTNNQTTLSSSSALSGV